MSGKYDDRLADYVDVKERVRLFYAAHPDGRLVTGEVRPSAEPDGIPRIWVQAFAYRDPADVHPGIGWSWMELPGKTPYTKGSELENVETSAWGRAIGALGIGIDKSIASADEVRAKSVDAKLESSDDGGLVGIAEAGDKNTSDFLVRNSADGPALGFRLRGVRGGILVETRGDLAAQLFHHRDAVVGSRVTVWGAIADREFPGKAGKPSVKYQALTADRIRVPVVGDLPMEGEPAEAPSQPMFSEDEQRALDEAMGLAV